MKYLAKYDYLPRYQHTSHNQYGDRFKRIASKQIDVVRLSCKRNNASNLEDLIILGHILNVPVHYDFEKGEAFIEIMSADAVRKL